ncbi:desumoylating isopeptidase 2-like isoform X2 [Orbicella faveolata]|uniref:desumoylating isopeptidase 2-like isoform X2 n=1 Tax=Orbicella faveolata TaxID=48498 RepID=UPI0009E4C773|nr:desumoylating isopeptidase 2-like isoform X2 [Orbicella faveolata]
MSGYPVVLNVYDMYWINQYTFPVGLGVFHSGVVVHGKEYAFGGHPNNWSGIFEMSPKSVEVLGDDFKFRETLTIGTTKLLPSEVEDLLRRMGKNYQGRFYHLIDKNCNHFTSEFCQALCNKSIPAWVNRLASVGSYLPFLLKCIPREWISPEPCSPTRSPSYVSHPFKDCTGSDEDDQPRTKTKHR